MTVATPQPAPRRTSIGARRNPECEAAVLAAARDLLVERGYAGFSIDEVARRASAGKPTIYRWWPTKADLFIAIFAAEKDAALVLPDTGSLRQDLELYTLWLWSFWRTNPAGRALRGLIAEAQSNATALRTVRDKFLPERLPPIQALFERAVARGEIAGDRVDERIALWVGYNWFHLLTDDIEDDAAAVGRVMDLLVR